MEKQHEDGLLKVVHQNKIEKFLKNLDLLNDLNSHKIKCKFCVEILLLENINAIFPEKNEIKISCNKPECVVKLTEYLNDKNL